MNISVIGLEAGDEFDLGRSLCVFLAAYGSIRYPFSFALLENGNTGRMLGDYIFELSYSEKIRSDGTDLYLICGGQTVAPFVEKNYLRKRVSKHLVEIAGERMYYIPQNCGCRPEVFGINFETLYREYREESRKRCNHMIVAIEENRGEATNIVINDTDTVIIVLPVKEFSLLRYMEKYKSIRNKCIYVLFSHEKNIRKLKKKMVLEYSVPKDRLIILPAPDHSNHWIQEGRLVNYVDDELMKGVEEHNRDFHRGMNELCTEVLLKKDLMAVAEDDFYGRNIKNRYFSPKR